MRSRLLASLFVCAALGLTACGNDSLHVLETGELKAPDPFAPPPSDDPADPADPTEPDPEAPEDPVEPEDPEAPVEPDPDPAPPDPVDPVEPGAPIPGWARSIGGSGFDEARAIVVDGSGNVTVAGFFRASIQIGAQTFFARGDQTQLVPPADVYLVSYDSDGLLRWSHHFGSDFHDEPQELAVDGEGNVTLIGSQQGAIDFGGGPVSSPGGEGSEVFVASFSAQGAHRWSRAFGGPGLDLGRGVSAAPDGGACIAGQYDGVLDMGPAGSVEAVYALDGFVACLDATGAPRWVRSLGGFYMDGMWGVAVRDDGTTYVSGEYDASSGDVTADGVPLPGTGWETYLAVYGPAGEPLHITPYGSSGSDGTKGVGVDANGNVFLGGLYGGALDFGGGALPFVGGHDAFVVSFNGDFQHRWSVGFGDQGFDQVLDLTMDPSDNVILVGRYDDVLDVAETTLNSDGGYDLFVASYTPAGDPRWAVSVGGVGNEQAMATAAGPDGEVYLVGSFEENMSHGAGNLLYSEGGTDSFILKLQPED